MRPSPRPEPLLGGGGGVYVTSVPARPCHCTVFVCLYVCVCVTPNHFNNIIAFAIIHHLSTAMFALQQCLVFRPVAAFPPSQHDIKTMYRFHAPTAPGIPACPCADPSAGAPLWASLRQHTAMD